MPHFFYHHLHTVHLHGSEFSQMALSRTIRAFAVSMSAFFVPIYIIQVNGGNIQSSWGQVAAFFITMATVRFFTTPIVSIWISKYGPKHIFAFSIMFDAITLAMLPLLTYWTWLVWVIGFIHGFGNTLSFTALHADMSAVTKKSGQIKKVSSVEIFRKIALSAGPLVGGLIAGLIDPFYSFLIASLIVLLSLKPLNLHKEPIKEVGKLNFSDFRRLDAGPNLRSNFGFALNSQSAVYIWTLFIYLFFESYEAVGVIISLSLIAGLVIMRLTGVYSSKSAVHKEIKYGSSGTSVVHLLRSLASTVGVITLINILNDIAYAMLHVSYIGQYYAHTNKRNRLAYITMMEMSLSLGIIVFWVVSLALVAWLPIKAAFIAMFVVSALGIQLAPLIEVKPKLKA